MKTLIIPNVNIPLLRKQRDAFLDIIEYEQIDFTNEQADYMAGLTELLDTMVDIGEDTNLRRGIK